MPLIRESSVLTVMLTVSAPSIRNDAEELLCDSNMLDKLAMIDNDCTLLLPFLKKKNENKQGILANTRE